MAGLVKIHLNDNQITTVADNAFAGVPAVMTINLSMNRLTVITRYPIGHGCNYLHPEIFAAFQIILMGW